jgi:hypothetical protein
MGSYYTIKIIMIDGYLMALPDKEAKTVALNQQGFPVVPQSDNGREFVAKVIEELTLL